METLEVITLEHVKKIKAILDDRTSVEFKRAIIMPMFGYDSMTFYGQNSPEDIVFRREYDSNTRITYKERGTLRYDLFVGHDKYDVLSSGDFKVKHRVFRSESLGRLTVEVTNFATRWSNSQFSL
jgi:hypothetical protein